MSSNLLRTREGRNRACTGGAQRLILEEVAAKTRLPSSVIPDAEAILERAVEAHLLRGRSTVAVVASSLVLASNKNGAGLVTDEVAAAARSTGKYSVTASEVQNTLRLLAHELSIGPEYTYSAPGAYVHGILIRLGIDDDVLEREVLHLISSLDRMRFQGYNPLSVAGASIYLAGRDKRISQSDIARCCFVSEATLRTVTKRIREGQSVELPTTEGIGPSPPGRELASPNRLEK